MIFDQRARVGIAVRRTGARFVMNAQGSGALASARGPSIQNVAPLPMKGQRVRPPMMLAATPPSAARVALDDSRLPPAGTRLGEFEILRPLGIGGFGIVYLSLDQSLLRKVALKEFMPAELAARGSRPSTIRRWFGSTASGKPTAPRAGVFLALAIARSREACWKATSR